MITQEMVKLAEAEYQKALGEKFGYTQTKSGTWFTDAMESSLTAVYPLIRQQVIAECAAVCDGLEGMFIQKLENSVIQTWCSPKDCSAAVRNLKDKTDEAHNG